MFLEETIIVLLTTTLICRIGVKSDDLCRFCCEDDEEIEHFQRGCAGLDFCLATTVRSETDLNELCANSEQLLRELRKTERELLW